MSRGTGEGKTGRSPRRFAPRRVVQYPVATQPGAMLWTMSRGISLMELLLVITLTGLLALLAVPSWGAVRDRLAVAGATELVTAAHTRARLVAAAERRPAVLLLTADSLILRVVESPTDTVERWRAVGPRQEGVEVTGMPKVVLFAPSGATFGLANATYQLSRGDARKQVVVSRYGRVRVN